ncbi:MAG: ABC transporter ATP-binding protein [Anaerolineales bacterium]
MDSKLAYHPHTDLRLERISKRFDDLLVIDDVSLEVYKGELCCLLGPSGCGKTTTLNVIAGFLEHEEGSVYLAEREITGLPPQERDVGMVFQNYALFPHLSVFDNVAYGLRRRGWSLGDIRKNVAEILELVQLSGYEKRGIQELSGGQQQRIALARALVIEPELLLLDEPLSNLDARLRIRMRGEIRRIQRALDITTVYVTHDQEEAMSIADRIVIMHQGVIEQIGTPEEIYEQPANRFVADFIGRVNLFKGRVEGERLHLLGRTFLVPKPRWPEGEVTCAIRPERVRLIPEAGASLTAVIEEATYTGSFVHYHLAADEGTRIHAEVPSPDAVYEPGLRVGVGWEVEDIHFFPV